MLIGETGTPVAPYGLSDKALSQFITCRIVILKKKIGYTPVLE
jgi:hypothetical protein